MTGTVTVTEAPGADEEASSARVSARRSAWVAGAECAEASAGDGPAEELLEGLFEGLTEGAVHPGANVTRLAIGPNSP